MSKKAENQDKAKRKPITHAELEQAISEAVKASQSDCENFVGVIVQRIAPALQDGANWRVKGIRYGKANREACAVALAKCLDEFQLEFELSD